MVEPKDSIVVDRRVIEAFKTEYITSRKEYDKQSDDEKVRQVKYFNDISIDEDMAEVHIAKTTENFNAADVYKTQKLYFECFKAFQQLQKNYYASMKLQSVSMSDERQRVSYDALNKLNESYEGITLQDIFAGAQVMGELTMR